MSKGKSSFRSDARKLGVYAVAGISIATILGFRKLTDELLLPPLTKDYAGEILGLDPLGKTITTTSAGVFGLDGRYGLFHSHDHGYLKIGKILESGPDYVRRELIRSYGAVPRVGSKIANTGYFYQSPSELDLSYEKVEIEGPLGTYPAWAFTGNSSSTWVIQVHGRAANKSEGLRMVPLIEKLGFNSLLVSYRNDPEAPKSADGRYALGSSEWEDVHAAMLWALSRGAKRIYLAGWSMGGSIVIQTLLRSELSPYLKGVVLESAVGSWKQLCQEQLSRRGMPAILCTGASAILNSPLHKLLGVDKPINFREVDIVLNAEKYSVPILALHSIDDQYVPSAAIEQLARKRSDIVSLKLWKNAGHTRLWNYDSDLWEQQITEWFGENS